MQIDESQVLWSTPERERAGKPLLVLLHGYGSHEGDLFALAPYLPLDTVVAAPRAFDRHPMGVGYSWFTLPQQLSTEWLDPGPLDAAADALHDWLATAAADASSVGILGFSQGGMIGIQLARRHPESLDRLVLLSTMVPAGDESGDDRLASLPVFWGRGTRDDVIPRSGVEHTLGWLPGRVRLTERVYEGLGHGVDDRMLGDVVAFLRET